MSAPDAPRRTLRVAAVQLWSSPAHTPDDNRAHALDLLETAARARPDLVVLPEAVAMLCYPDGRPDFTYHDVAEPVPGPTTEAAAALARRHGVHVALGLIAAPGPGTPPGARCQNTVVVIDRAGRVAGRYDKLHEPEACRTAQAAGRGDALPLFDVDGVRAGVFVCWDLLAPEIPALLALGGAEVLLFPHLIGLPAARNFAVALRARAVDNALPVVAAGMRDVHSHTGSQEGLFPTCILDANGEVVAQSTVAGPDVVRATLDLGPVRVDHVGRLEPGVDWTAHRPTELRPDLYARLYAEVAASRRAKSAESP